MVTSLKKYFDLTHQGDVDALLGVRIIFILLRLGAQPHLRPAARLHKLSTLLYRIKYEINREHFKYESNREAQRTQGYSVSHICICLLSFVQFESNVDHDVDHELKYAHKIVYLVN